MEYTIEELKGMIDEILESDLSTKQKSNSVNRIKKQIKKKQRENKSKSK